MHELLKEQLIDEFYTSIIPVLLGKLFKDGRPE
jgi:dihydrofolate reductase